MKILTIVHRYAHVIQGISAALILAAVILLMRALPLESGLQLLTVRVQSLGAWGPLIYAVIYAVAAVLFVPGSALTLAAGAIFGLFWGTITVSIGATGAAALSFLIARYLARDKIAELAAANPKFDAIDKAIGEGGWKIVALLRLSPAMPFNLQNYLYGLTAIRFWPCILTSWVFMLPGGFLYVYLGHIGSQGLAAAGGAGEKGAGQWALLGVGLLATIAVSVYVTRLANREIQKRTAIAGNEAAPEAPPVEISQPQAWPRGVMITAAVAILVFGSALYAYIERDALRGLFGPPRVELSEAYAPGSAQREFDHSVLDVLLSTHVDQHGWVDYDGLARDAAQLDTYIASLAGARFDELGRNEKLALLINAYNAFTLRLILDYYPLASILEIPGDKRWDDRRWRVGGRLWSLSEIEHEQIRPKFIEPRAHFALNCASIGCPKLRNEAYRGDRIDEQLADQAHYIHSDKRWFVFDAAADVLWLTQLYDWYRSDFEQAGGPAPHYAALFSPSLKQALDEGREPAIHWLQYDWSLNQQQSGSR